MRLKEQEEEVGVGVYGGTRENGLNLAGAETALMLSKDDDALSFQGKLLVAQCHPWINSRSAERREPAGQERDGY
jgi:hypothetical protein